MTKTKSFAIVGGGIGGLTLGIALQRKGISVEIFENAPEIKPLGAGIVLAANALKAFRAIGLENEILAAGNTMKRFSIRNQDGKILTTTENDRIRSRWGLVNTVTLHRADLHAVLLNSIKPGTLHLGKGCTGFSQNTSRVSVLFGDGSSREFDFVAAADGVHSVFRQNLVADSKPRYAGYTCWRGLTDQLPPGFDGYEAFETWGSGKRFGVVPLSRNRIYWYATVNAPQGDANFGQYGVSELVRMFHEFHAPVPGIISSTQSQSIVHNDIIDVKPITKFAFDRIVLSGDAAHATTPNMGQGACMAIEDAVVLANCISGNDDVQNAFRRYERLRIERTTRIVNSSYTLGKIGQWGNPLLVTLRNSAMRFTPQRVSDKQLEFLFNVHLADNV